MDRSGFDERHVEVQQSGQLPRGDECDRIHQAHRNFQACRVPADQILHLPPSVSQLLCAATEIFLMTIASIPASFHFVLVRMLPICSICKSPLPFCLSGVNGAIAATQTAAWHPAMHASAVFPKGTQSPLHGHMAVAFRMRPEAV
jgi:hypothetical protein